MVATIIACFGNYEKQAAMGALILRRSVTISATITNGQPLTSHLESGILALSFKRLSIPCSRPRSLLLGAFTLLTCGVHLGAASSLDSP